jgi:pimeloyl-ACP methyl ester carboxylesterase
MSMGGAIAQEIALLVPDRLRTLTLVVTFAGSGNWATERARLWSEIRGLLDHERHLDWLLLFGMSEDFYESPRRVEYSKQLMRANPNPQSTDAFQRQVEASGRHEARDRVGQISVPTHVIGAEHDTLVPVWKSKEIAELIPGADYSVMPGAPHALNMERAEEFNEIVLGWLRSNSGPSDPRERGSAQPTPS